MRQFVLASQPWGKTMKQIILAGQPWIVWSPSKFTHAVYPIWMVYDGKAWRLALNGTWSTAQYNRRDIAAEVVSLALDPENIARFM